MTEQKVSFQNLILFQLLYSESNEFLKFLTQQAVAMAKTMTAMQNKTNVKGHLPLPMQPPERVINYDITKLVIH